MLFALYGILMLGGIYLLGISFSLPAFQGLAFALGVLITCAALAVPITASAFENRR